MPVKIFFCYAHEDEPLLNEIKMHLRPLQRQAVIELWYDCQINAGAEWEREIDKHLNSSQIVLLLISSNFIDSDYCYSVEMQRAMKRHERGEAIVVPVILRPTDWEHAPFSKLQALPKDGKPLTTWNNRDEALLNVAKGIRKVIEEFTPPLSTNEQLSKPAEESEISSTTSEVSSTSLVTTASEEAEKSTDHLNDICLLLIKIQKRLYQSETFKTEGNLEGILINWKNVNMLLAIEVILNEMKRTREYIKDSQETSILTKKITLLLKIDTSIKEATKAVKAFSGIKSAFVLIFFRMSTFYNYQWNTYNNHLKKCEANLIDILVEIS